ncbi:MAG: hypothetical protein HOH77_02940 [Candidatus Latescibacteria bacterium]|jgi:hypothetical protein|nr:hypothetical protein [Candidatus Latescibacterota bacterium]
MNQLRITNCLSFSEFLEGMFRFEGQSYEVIYSKSYCAKKGGVEKLAYQIITIKRVGESYSSDSAVCKAFQTYLESQKWAQVA